MDSYFIYLLDNGSTDNSVEALKSNYENHPKIELRLFEQNFGFTKAHNLILKELLRMEYKYVFLLNNDTVLDPNCLKNIQDLLKSSNPDMISCKMINYWDRSLMDNAGHRIMTSGEIIPKFHGANVDNFTTSFENSGPCAGAAIYSIKMLKDIGIFDEYFNTGYEDAEIGLRAIIAGYKSVFYPNLIVFHKMGQSIKKVFNYEYSLKIQSSIFYTYLKLVHIQILLLYLLPFILRLFTIILIDIVFWRPKFLKVQCVALYGIFFKDFKKIMEARRQSLKNRKISWKNLLKIQESTLKRDFFNFIKYIIKGEKSYFEKY